MLVARPQRVRVIRPEDALPVREQLAVQTQRLVRVPRLAGPVGDAVARPQRVGVVGAQNAFSRIPQRARRSSGSASPYRPWARSSSARLSRLPGRVGVVGAQRLLADRQRPAEQRLRLPVPALGPEQPASSLRLWPCRGGRGPAPSRGSPAPGGAAAPPPRTGPGPGAARQVVRLRPCRGGRGPAPSRGSPAPGGTAAPPPRTGPGPGAIRQVVEARRPCRGGRGPAPARGSPAPGGAAAPPPRTGPGPGATRQVVEAVGRVGVVGAQRRLADRQRPAEQRLRLPVPALGPEQHASSLRL